jgi:hypothetical protein
MFIWLKLPQAISADIGLDRRQKAWFLPAAPAGGACGASAAISAGRGFCPLRLTAVVSNPSPT